MVAIFWGLIAVIALWFVAILVWNLGQFRATPRFSVLGFVRFIAGVILMFGALFVLYESFPQLTQQEYSYVAIGTFVAALAADFLIGDDIRARLRRR